MEGYTSTVAAFEGCPPGRERERDVEGVLRDVFEDVTRVRACRRTEDGCLLLYVDFVYALEGREGEDADEMEWRWLDGSDEKEKEILEMARSLLKTGYVVLDSVWCIKDG